MRKPRWKARIAHAWRRRRGWRVSRLSWLWKEGRGIDICIDHGPAFGTVFVLNPVHQRCRRTFRCVCKELRRRDGKCPQKRPPLRVD